jgi:hypothetical protein
LTIRSRATEGSNSSRSAKESVSPKATGATTNAEKLIAVLLAVKGFAAPETGQAYARARELWEQLGSPSEFLQIPFGQSRYHAHRGELDLAQRLDEDLLHLSRKRNDSAGLILGHDSSGRNLFICGRFAVPRTGDRLWECCNIPHAVTASLAGSEGRDVLWLLARFDWFGSSLRSV